MHDIIIKRYLNIVSPNGTLKLSSRKLERKVDSSETSMWKMLIFANEKLCFHHALHLRSLNLLPSVKGLYCEFDTRWWWVQKVRHGAHNLQFSRHYQRLKIYINAFFMLRVSITLSNLSEVHSHVSIGTLLVGEVRPTHHSLHGW